MSRTLSSPAYQAIYAQETGEEFIILLKIDHTDLGAPIFVAGAKANVVSNGDTYLACPFQISLPQERDDSPPQVTLTIDNVDRTIVNAIRSIASPPTVDMSVVLGSSPNTLEAGPFAFTMRQVNYDALVVSGELSYEQILDQAFPAHTFTPNFFPALF